MINKNTDTLQSVEQKIMERLKILENGETYDIKKKARKEIIRLEKHLNDVNGKIINGKHYGERIYHSDDKPMDKEEIFKLIDSVDSDNFNQYNSLDTRDFQLEQELYRPGVKI